MSDRSLSMQPMAGREAIPASMVGRKMRGSLNVVMEWQKAELPPRYAIGSGDLRKVAIRVREQPINFMMVLHQSIHTAKGGISLCKSGLVAVEVLLGGEDYSERDKTRFVTKTLDNIKNSASHLNNHTNDIKSRFRTLRTAVMDLHKCLNTVTSDEQRSAFLARLSRVLSKDVGICEEELRSVRDNLDEIENSLNFITQWWQKVESEANYLQMNGGSSLVARENKIILVKIGESFKTLKKWFADYIDTMSQLFDENIVHLNDADRKFLEENKDSSKLLEPGGR